MNVPDINDYHSSFGKTIREIAESESDPYRKRKLLILASELETMFNSQASNTRIAIGGAEISWHARIDELLDRISEIKNDNTITHRVIDQISSDVQDLSDVMKSQGASVVQIRLDFQGVVERIGGIVNEVSILKDQMIESQRIGIRLSKSEKELRSKITELMSQVDDMRLQFETIALKERETPS